jgi:glycosyltransferase involved in cell wall biosynthesis
LKKRILFVSSVNLSTNPRILKEIKLAHALNYNVSFLGFNLGNWSDKLDNDLLKGIPWLNSVYLDATRKSFITWLMHSLQERLNRFVWRLRKDNLFLASTASTKRTFGLVNYGRAIRPGAFDLVIGHTLAAFYPSLIIAQNAGCYCAFDVEDYHPGEYTDADNRNEIRRRELIMKRILPHALYVSVSSPLIGLYTKELCKLDDEKVVPVLNFFSAEEFQAPALIKGKKIRLIWFSQLISRGRGLEMLLSAWKELSEDFELTLVGSIDPTFRDAFQSEIEIIKPLSQIKLHALLGEYDVGLALDLTSRDFNRDIALTNKILAYYQAGLYTLATDTAAQEAFIKQYPGCGLLFSQNDRNSFLVSLGKIRDHIVDIRQGAAERYRNASANNWEKESYKLKTLWTEAVK